jgi:NADH pyrophosphatase NudC (nudix superfamily)
MRLDPEVQEVLLKMLLEERDRLRQSESRIAQLEAILKPWKGCCGMCSTPEECEAREAESKICSQCGSKMMWGKGEDSLDSWCPNCQTLDREAE